MEIILHLFAFIIGLVVFLTLSYLFGYTFRELNEGKSFNKENKGYTLLAGIIICSIIGGILLIVF